MRKWDSSLSTKLNMVCTSRLPLIISILIIVCIAAARFPGEMLPRAWLPFVSRAQYLPPVCPPGVTVLPNSTLYIASGNHPHVVGEVCNNTSNTIWDVTVYVNFLNSSGGIMSSGSYSTPMTHLSPHTRTCFDVGSNSYGGIERAVTYQFEPATSSVTVYPRPNLTVISSQSTLIMPSLDYDVTGVIRYDGSATIHSVMPVITLYNSEAKVVACEYTYTYSSTLTAGQSSGFESYIYGRDFSNVVQYSVQVDGWEY